MSNLLKVAREEYLRLAKKRSFVLALVGVPVFIGVIIAVAIFAARSAMDLRPVGYVDLSGITASPSLAQETQSDRYLPFDTEEAAREAVNRGEITGYYVVPQDYPATRDVTFYSGEGSTMQDRGDFAGFLRGYLLAQAPAESRDVLARGIEFVYRNPASGRDTRIEGLIVSFIIPFVIGFFFIMVVMSSGGYLLQAVTTEKENRMMEVMITSVSPFQLIAGKAVGLIGVALTQVVVWLAALVVGLAIAAPRVEFLSELAIPWRTIGLSALFFLPTYVLLAGMMITVGSMVTELQHGQQIAGLFNLLFAVPFFFLVLIFTDPDGPLMVALTLFPTTSMMTIAMRNAVTVIPLWQIALGLLLVALAGLGSLWLAARVFRLGMLSYGQPLSVKSIMGLFRPARIQASATRGA